MKHEIDLEKYSIRTDLALEILKSTKNKNIFKINVKKYKNIKITEVNIDSKASEIINKKCGKYITIEFNDVTDTLNKTKLKKYFTKELGNIIKLENKEDLVLIVGLGNTKSTPDSLGPKTIDNIVITNHLYELGICDKKYQRVAAISPSVTGVTGIETIEQIISLVNLLKPKLIIAIDSLASMSIEHVNKTIQITNAGIHPGSGIGNSRKELSKDTLNTDIIAIGVPTVVDAVQIVSDTINYMHKNYSFSKYNLNKAKYKLTAGNVNYLEEKLKIKSSDKKDLLGLIGSLSDIEVKQLISEVLSPIGYNLMVTPKEIDFTIEILANIIGESLNDFFSK